MRDLLELSVPTQGGVNSCFGYARSQTFLQLGPHQCPRSSLRLADTQSIDDFRHLAIQLLPTRSNQVCAQPLFTIHP